MATADNSKSFYLRTAVDAKKIAAAVSKLEPTKEKPYTIKISIDGESRSNKQNRLSFLWYRFIGKETGHGEEYERHMCKLTYGIPILRQDAEFNAFYAEAIEPMVYEKKLAAMEYVPVTRLMKVCEFSQYLNAIDNTYAEKGIVLPQPMDLYWDALMKVAGNMGVDYE